MLEITGTSLMPEEMVHPQFLINHKEIPVNMTDNL